MRLAGPCALEGPTKHTSTFGSGRVDRAQGGKPSGHLTEADEPGTGCRTVLFLVVAALEAGRENLSPKGR